MPESGLTDETLLEVSNVEVIYNHVILVLKGVSLKVPKSGITALLGGNGAGKSTTLKSISNLLLSERGEITKGSVKYRGAAVAGLSCSWSICASAPKVARSVAADQADCGATRARTGM